MNDDRARDALELAERVLAHAEREGASESEALVMAEDAALTRFANSQIHQNVAETNVALNLRFVVGNRVGVASSGRTDDEGLDFGGARVEGQLDRALRVREGAPGLRPAHHFPTPTWTSRNRAPEQAWPTWPPWPGSPLPQFGVPSIT